nr:AMP-binding protein [Sphingobium sp. EM0848]
MEHWRHETPDKIALVEEGERAVTYAELGRWTDGVAAQLQAKGVMPGQVVAVTGANCLEWVAAAFGALKAGATLIPFNERFVRDEMSYLLETTEPTVIIADSIRTGILRAANARAQILAMEDLGIYRDGAPGWAPPHIESDAIDLVVFTSGSTGKPKGVMFSHGGHVSKIYEIILKDRALDSNVQYFLAPALQSGAGSMLACPIVLTAGGTLHFIRKHDPDLILRLLVEQRITFIPGYPFLFEELSRLPGFDEADLTSLRAGHTGGNRIPDELLAKWRARGVGLRQMYGQTEVCGYACIASDREILQGKSSCGQGMVHTELRVARPDGSDCEPDEPGEVWVRGPGMMEGYWRNPTATAQTIVNGWIRTGDLGLLDEDGDFRFIDRVNDMIKTGGLNVSPSEVEGIIGAFEGVVECAVFSVPDRKFGEATAACVYADPLLDPQLLFAHCKQHLADFKVPSYIVPFDKPLPRLGNGKMNKLGLKKDYADMEDRFHKCR